jgi:Putative zinc-finger
MQEFTSRKESPTAPPDGHWPSDEDLAAYIDGTLGKAESRRIAEHLADCEECFAIYMGTVQFQLEEGNVVPFPSRRWLYRIAALLVVGVGAGGAYYALLAPPPALVTAEVVRSLPGKPEIIESRWRGPTLRGAGDEGEEIAFDAAAFQTGVQLVNLQVSLAGNQGEDAQDVVTRIYNILKDQIAVGDLPKRYTEITASIDNKTPPATLTGKASQLAEETREVFDAPHLDLGQWVEAGRLAAIAEEPSFFENSDNRSFLRRLLWRQKLGIGKKDMALDPGARQNLQDISRALGKGRPGRSEYAKLRKDFEAILQIYYPEVVVGE